MTRASGAVPVLMYHSIGRRIRDWHWAPRLNVPAAAFEDHLRWLSRTGHHVATLDELHAHVSGAAPLPARSVVLTFDDGYVDNWTYAAPLLARYGMSGTILVNPEFVDPQGVVRPTLADVEAGRVLEKDLAVRGFMSWAELRKASESGVFSVQCHALTHSWYPTGPRVVDFHHPNDSYFWLDWNAFPYDKPFYLRDPGTSNVPYGTPVYEHAKSLEATQFFPPESEVDHIVEFTRKRGGVAFFADAAWRRTLAEEMERFRGASRETGRYETPDERRERYLHELVESKRLIEQHVGKPVHTLVWPGDGYNEESMAIARGIFTSVTVDPLKRPRLRNRPGENPHEIYRMGVPLIARGRRFHCPGGRYLSLYLDEFRGRWWPKRGRQVMKRGYLAAARLGLWS